MLQEQQYTKDYKSRDTNGIIDWSHVPINDCDNLAMLRTHAYKKYHNYLKNKYDNLVEYIITSDKFENTRREFEDRPRVLKVVVLLTFVTHQVVIDDVITIDDSHCKKCHTYLDAEGWCPADCNDTFKYNVKVDFDPKYGRNDVRTSSYSFTSPTKI